MTSSLSFRVQGPTGDEATFTVNRMGELRVSGYDETYEQAFVAMGGEPSECAAIIAAWESESIPVLVEYVLWRWTWQDVAKLMVAAAEHAERSIDRLDPTLLDSDLVATARDFLGDLRRGAVGELPLKLLHDANKSKRFATLTNNLFNRGRTTSVSYGDAFQNGMGWASEVRSYGWGEPVTEGATTWDLGHTWALNNVRNSLADFFGFLSGAVRSASATMGHPAVVPGCRETQWQIGAMIDLCVEIESRKP
jgi:hypothetical protein